VGQIWPQIVFLIFLKKNVRASSSLFNPAHPHFEVHIFAQSYNPFNLKIGEGLLFHVLLMFGARCFQDYAKNRMLKLQNNKK